MKEGNRSTYFLQADEIDHLTIRYTDFGEKLNRKKAVEMIKFYAAAYDSVKTELGDTDVSYGSLNGLADEELYMILVVIRTELLRIAFD